MKIYEHLLTNDLLIYKKTLSIRLIRYNKH